MKIKAVSKYVQISPYKLRPVADVIRGKTVENALAWLKTSLTRRVEPIYKAVSSAYANARNLYPDINSGKELSIKLIKIDQGPILKYFKPSAQGRAAPMRRRLSHIEVILERVI